MDEVIIGLLAILGGLGVFLLLTTLGGTILWWVWPIIPVVFPGLITSGYLTATITWFQAVGLSWISAILFKSSNIQNK